VSGSVLIAPARHVFSLLLESQKITLFLAFIFGFEGCRIARPKLFKVCKMLPGLRSVQVLSWSSCMENQNTDRVDPKRNAGKPPAEPPHNPDLVPQVPPPVAHKTERTYSSPDPTPLWKIVLEIGAVAVGIVVAWIYYGQLDVMRGQLGEIIKQYSEIKKSADANVKAADQTEKAVNNAATNFRLDQRAWVGAKEPKVDTSPVTHGITFMSGITNTGKTPAFITNIRYNAKFFDGYRTEIPANPPYSSKTTFRRSMVVFPNTGREFGMGPEYGTNDLNDVMLQKKTLSYYGVIEYTDIFGHSHFTKFCYQYVWSILTHWQLPTCKTYNDTDDIEVK
jgi:hypothetical protein